MYPFSVVEMDVFFHRPCHFVLGLIAVTTDGLDFEAPEKALHDRIIPTIATSTHAGLDTQFRQPVLVDVAGVLAALVGMEQQATAERDPPLGIKLAAGVVASNA